MNQAILLNFIVDKENKKIKVRRSFDASLPIVWQAWTDAEILDQWWAPHPWKNKTISMDFREGGRWFYVMRSPEHTEAHWCLVNFTTIVHHKHFASEDAFCNEKGEIDLSFPSNKWETQFTSTEEQTLVNLTLSFEKVEDLEAMIQMGFKEGLTKGLEQLDEWLKQQNR